MFNLIKQLFMIKTNEEKGVLAKDMSLEELQALAVQLKVLTAEEVSKMKKPAILKAVTAWEKKAIVENKDEKTGLRKLGKSSGAVEKAEDIYEGKKVISRTTRELNGRKVEDILVETGETFTNPLTI